MAQKILVIDDAQTAADLASNVFARHFPGCDVFVAPGSGNVFERLTTLSPDLILLNDDLADIDARVILSRIQADPFSAQTPVLLFSDAARAADCKSRFPNVARILAKPVAPDTLIETIGGLLGASASSRRLLPGRTGGIVFTGHTGVISLRQALHIAQTDRLTGLLRFHLGRHPVEVWMNNGRILLATTRNFHLYCGGSPVILSATNLGQIIEAEIHQQMTGCPIFLYLSVRNGFPHEDVVEITREHGQRLFGQLYTAGRIGFEFEEMPSLPDYVAKFPVNGADADNWLLASLRHVRFEQLAPTQRPDPAGAPAYTRRGYELVQHLKLNDVEARFAAAANGTDSHHVIADKLGIALNDSLLVAFRFQSLEIVEFWNSSTLSLPGEPTGAH